MKQFAPWKVILVSNLKLPIYIVRLHVWSTKRRCYCVFAIFKREIGNVSIGCQMLYTIVIIRVVSPSDSREARCSLSLLKFGPNCGVTGKYFLEAFILPSVNPQYDKGLFIEFPKQYKFRTCCVQKLFFFVFVLTFKTIFVHNMFWTCIFRGIQRTISCHIVV